MLTFKEMYELGIKMGIKADPRGASKVKFHLEQVKKQYAGTKEDDKKYFDQERLVNPYYDDCRMHTGNPKAPIKRILVGIDIGEGEVLLATQLSERGQKIDAVIAHHTLGGSKASLTGVMGMNTDRYEEVGMPVHVAEKIIANRQGEVHRSLHAYNHYQIIDIARPLAVNLMNIHTATDNLVDQFLQNFLTKKKIRTVGDIMDALMEIPEFQEGKTRGAGPLLVAGSPQNKVGRFVLEMTGGVNPGEPLYPELSRAGVSTVIAMHMTDDARAKAAEHSMNAIISGHIPSDSLGMNLYLDELEKRGVEIVPCGGLIRVSRVKKRK